jgi:hypothetical protein
MSTIEKQIESAEIVIKNQGGEYDDANVSCNAIDCRDCFGNGFGCGLTYTDFKGFMDKHNPEPKLTTKLELENATEFKEVHEPMTYAEKQERDILYIHKRNQIKKDELLLSAGGGLIASYEDGKVNVCSGSLSIKEAQALNKWLTKMLEVK